MIRVLTGLISCLVVYIISKYVGQLIGDGFDEKVGSFFGLTLTVIICCRWVLPSCTIVVPGNKAYIISDTLRNEESKERKEFSGLRKLKAQRELQAGFHWKFPWEKPILAVDMSRMRSVKSDPEKVYTLKSKKTIKIQWRVFYGALPGNAVNHTQTKPEDIDSRVFDRADSFLQGYVGGKETIGFDSAAIEEMRAAFVKHFKDSDYIDNEERNLGIWTDTPEIIDIDEAKEVQAARNFEQVMQTNIDLAKKIVDMFGGAIHPNDALRTVLMSGGKLDLNLVEIGNAIPPFHGKNKKQGKKGGQNGNKNQNN